MNETKQLKLKARIITILIRAYAEIISELDKQDIPEGEVIADESLLICSGDLRKLLRQRRCERRYKKRRQTRQAQQPVSPSHEPARLQAPIES